MGNEGKKKILDNQVSEYILRELVLFPFSQENTESRLEGISISHPRLPKLVTIQAQLQKGIELRIRSYPIFGECLKEQAVSSYQINIFWGLHDI